MTGVFLDTVGLLALWDMADQWHAAAEEALSRVLAQAPAVAIETTRGQPPAKVAAER